MTSAHGNEHWDPDNCFGCKMRTLQFGNVTPPPERETERWQDKDLPAYQRLRRSGLQPRSIRHAAELEGRAESQLEVEMGKLIDPKLLRKHRSQIQEGMAMARDAEYTVADIAEWKKARDKKEAEK